VFLGVDWVVLHRNCDDLRLQHDWIWNLHWDVDWEGNFDFLDDWNFDLLVHWILLDMVVVDCVDAVWD
jgi:hypothetical protein